MTWEQAIQWLSAHPAILRALASFAVLLGAFASYFVVKRYLLKALNRLVSMTKTNLDDMLLRPDVLKKLSVIAPLVVLYSFAHVFGYGEDTIRTACAALIALFALLTAGALLSGANDVYQSLEISQGRSIRGYVQVLQIILYVAGTVVIISTLLGRSPAVLLSGIGAMMAVILLIFRDTILSLVASIQITTHDLVRVGDWIEVPKFGADGDVTNIALHTVTVQNFDKTLTHVPTHKLIESSFKNWRGMKQAGGRRIKRALYLDMETVCFCNEAMLEKFSRIQLISEYVKTRQREIQEWNTNHGADENNPVNGRRMTNLGTFRQWVSAYLKTNERIHKGMTFLVRQLAPTPNGLPLEIYVFAADTVWAHYESIQADIFDHVLAAAPQFGLRIFQNPTGNMGALANRQAPEPGEAP